MGDDHLENLVSTGIPGLDDVLLGGLTAGKMHILSGSPGTGKTTFALQFLADGIRKGELCLYVALDGAEKDLFGLADAGGIFLDPDRLRLYGVKISGEILEGPEQRIFHSAESELAGVLKDIIAEVRRVKPTRLVIDSLSDLRFLVDDPVSYRRFNLALRKEFSSENSTTLITSSNAHPSDVDLHLETICHGVIRLEQVVVGYGPVRRRLLVVKVRGRAYRSGWHDFRIVTAGVEVFPTLVAGEHKAAVPRELLASSNARLGSLLGGGLDRGSAVAIVGAAGTGKTTMANQFVVDAGIRGERCVVYLFEETEDSYRERAEGLGLGVDEFVERGLVSLNHVNAAELCAGEFTVRLRHEVEEMGARVVVIDTVAGYANAMSDQQYQKLHLRELLTYLAYKGVTALLVVEQHGLAGISVLDTDIKNISFMADTIILLRFFEYRGEVKRAISVVKRRRGSHENTIAKLTLSSKGITIGEALVDMQGVLSGVPFLAR